MEKDNTKSYTGVAWRPNKEEIYTVGEFLRVFQADSTESACIRHREEASLLLCITWHPSGRFYVLGDYGRPDEGVPPLLQFRKPDHSLMSSSAISKAEYRNMSWSSKGKKLATASEALRIWNQKGKLKYQGPDEGFLWGVDWSPDGRYIVTSSQDGKIKIWDRKARLVKVLKD